MDLDRQILVEFLLHRQCDLRMLQSYLETLDHCLSSECVALAQDGQVSTELHEFRNLILARARKKTHALYMTLSNHREPGRPNFYNRLPKVKVKAAGAK